VDLASQAGPLAEGSGAGVVLALRVQQFGRVRAALRRATRSRTILPMNHGSTPRTATFHRRLAGTSLAAVAADTDTSATPTPRPAATATRRGTRHHRGEPTRFLLKPGVTAAKLFRVAAALGNAPLDGIDPYATIVFDAVLALAAAGPQGRAAR
jgi:hypothetical protein